MTDAYVCLNFGTADECPNCGGWTHADPEPGEPNNVEGVYGLRFCSEDCAAEYEERVNA